MPIASTEKTQNRKHRLDESHLKPPVQDVGLPLEMDAVVSAAGRNPLLQAGQMERQAEQLASEFQQQALDIDRREAEFNARAAQLENELRVARLVYREREISLKEKQGQLDGSLNELRQRNADMVAAQHALESEAVDAAQSRTSALNDVRRNTETWQKKVRDVENQQELLESQLADARQQQKRLSDYRQQYQKQLVELQHRSERLDSRQATVERWKEEASEMYREALEQRIATEELWAELQPLASAPKITSRIADLRRRLEDHYQLTHQRLDSRRSEIADLISRLEEHMSRLACQRDDLEGWVARRQSEIETHANRLYDREQELDAENAELEHMQDDWRRQRMLLEQEVERLEKLLSTSYKS